MAAQLQFRDVTLGYDRHPAVHHLSGEVASGALLAIVGPNGAGKSTLFRGLVGILKPLAGAIVTGDLNVRDIAYLPQTVDISTNELVQAMSRELREMTQAIRKVLQETPPELAADIIDNGIILTGGSSQLRMMPELVYRRTGVIAKLAADPYYCVARGTGIALKHLDTYRKSILAKQ